MLVLSNEARHSCTCSWSSKILAKNSASFSSSDQLSGCWCCPAYIFLRIYRDCSSLCILRWRLFTWMTKSMESNKV